jgi:hypothetical protein
MKPNLAEIRRSIQNGDLSGACEQLLLFAQEHSPRFSNEVIGQQSNLKQILAEERKGVVNAETTRLNKSRITYALLELIDEIKEGLRSSTPGDSLSPSPESTQGFHIQGTIHQLVIQQGSGNNVVENKEKVIEIGPDATISAPIVIADSLENSFQAVARSNLDDETKKLLQQLLTAINEVNKNAAPKQVETAKSMVREAVDLINEATGPKPRRKWYEVSIEGLKQAAANIGEVAMPVLEIVGKLTPLLLG